MTPLDPAYMLAALLTAPFWARKARGDWPARFGKTGALPEPLSGRKRLLLHAVSVGEVNALRALVPMLTARSDVVVSVGTDTGIARARELFASERTPAESRCRVVRYPLDFSWSVRRFLDAVRPEAVGLVELELWPQFIRECRRRDIPVAVINGRLSERSFRGYVRLRPLLRSTFASLEFAAVQDEAYARRFLAMGARHGGVHVTGSMKWDSAHIADSVAGADALATEMGIDRARPLVVVGSTGPLPPPPKSSLYAAKARRASGSTDEHFVANGVSRVGPLGEEGLLHGACLDAGPEVQLLCAPRRPERFDEAFVAIGGEAGGTACVRRSARMRAGAGCTRFLLDTIGELGAAYSLADVVVVGRSFGDLYGSDPIEPIALGKATVIGPRVSDFQTIVEEFEKAGGIVRTTGVDLARVLRELLADPAGRARLAARGRDCIRRNQGATRRHAEMLLDLTGRGGRVVVPAREAGRAETVR